MARVTTYHVDATTPAAELATKERVSVGHPPPAPIYAHCVSVTCENQTQERIAGEIDYVEILYHQLLGESGSRDPRHAMTDRSSVQLRAADPADVPCPACGRDRELSQQIRPVYERLSGHRPDFLRRVRQAGSIEDAMFSMQSENAKRLKALEQFAESEKAIADAEKTKAAKP